MRIIVRLLGTYRPLPDKSGDASGLACMHVPEGTTVAEALARLPIPTGSALTALVNGRHAESSQALKEGDEMSVFPAAGGG